MLDIVLRAVLYHTNMNIKEVVYRSVLMDHTRKVIISVLLVLLDVPNVQGLQRINVLYVCQTIIITSKCLLVKFNVL